MQKLSCAVLFMAGLFSGYAHAASEVAMIQNGGVYTVPVRVNDALTLDFIIDSGASEVHVPPDVVTSLLSYGALSQADFLPGTLYTLADGSQVKGQRFIIQKLQIGDEVVYQVPAGISASEGAPLLLGQSLLSRFSAWSIDNDRHVLILGEKPKMPPSAESPQPASEPSAPSVTRQMTMPNGDVINVPADKTDDQIINYLIDAQPELALKFGLTRRFQVPSATGVNDIPA